jgi:hypothetical protein
MTEEPNQYVTVIEYHWNDNTTERIVSPTESEILGVSDWLCGDEESGSILRQAGIKHITVSVREFELADINYMGFV